jgi:hypothetical protein
MGGPSINALLKIKQSEKNMSVEAMFDKDCIEMGNLFRGHIKDASYQVSVYLVKQFQRRRILFRNQPIRTKIASGGHV